MTDIEYNELEPGTYRAQFQGVEDFSYEDAKTGQTETRWRWKFLIEETGQAEDTLTSQSFKPGTNAAKFLTGLLGRPPMKGDRVNDRIGQDVDIVYGPNRAGNLTITGVFALRTPAAKAADLKAAQEGEGPLPFDGAEPIA